MEEVLVDDQQRIAPVRYHAAFEQAKVDPHDVAAFVRSIWPRAAAHLPKVRIGYAHDGGYVLPVNALSCDTVLSIGIGNNANFDFELAEFGMTVLQLDHTIERPPVFHENFRFHRYGWSAFSGRSLLSFADIMVLFQELNPERSILKFDIEGSEYEAFRVVSPDDIGGFEVITCELHGLHELGDVRFFERAMSLLETLGANHVPVHLHANNYRGTASIHGFIVPDVLELTYVHKALGPFAGYCADIIPGRFDQPNNPLAPDIQLTALQNPALLRATLQTDH